MPARSMSRPPGLGARAGAVQERRHLDDSNTTSSRRDSNSTAAALRQAEERLALVKEGPRKEEIAAAGAARARAQAALKISEANRIEVVRKQEDLTARRAEIERTKARLSVTEAQLEDTAATSPIDGVVLVKSAELGEVLAAGTTVAHHRRYRSSVAARLHQRDAISAA